MTTGGSPDITRPCLPEPDLEPLPENSHMRNKMAKPPIASVFGRILRIVGILVDRGRKGGGFELFLAGYAKCIVADMCRYSRVL